MHETVKLEVAAEGAAALHTAIKKGDEKLAEFFRENKVVRVNGLMVGKDGFPVLPEHVVRRRLLRLIHEAVENISTVFCDPDLETLSKTERKVIEDIDFALNDVEDVFLLRLYNGDESKGIQDFFEEEGEEPPSGGAFLGLHSLASHANVNRG